MRRASNPMPPALRSLCFNLKSGSYEIQESNIIYRMNLEETRSLRNYFRAYQKSGWNDFPTVEGWYRYLDKSEKKLVTRDGEIPVMLSGAGGFYPDTVWPD